MCDENRQTAEASRRTIWQETIPEEEWSVYQRVIAETRAQGVRFALGGAFALATYTGHWRNTKDLDLFILPQDRHTMVNLLSRTGLSDYYDQLPYDRGWIYRATYNDIIVDLIWAMANRRAIVDEAWLTRGPQVDIRGERVHILPAEELIWAKLYIMHRDRCDWPDVLNLIYATAATLDWEYLIQRMADDTLLLSGALCMFSWLCPGRAAALPGWVWDRLLLPKPQAGAVPEMDPGRAELLDSRPWFGPMLADAESFPSF